VAGVRRGGPYPRRPTVEAVGGVEQGPRSRPLRGAFAAPPSRERPDRSRGGAHQLPRCPARLGPRRAPARRTPLAPKRVGPRRLLLRPHPRPLRKGASRALPTPHGFASAVEGCWCSRSGAGPPCPVRLGPSVEGADQPTARRLSAWPGDAQRYCSANQVPSESEAGALEHRAPLRVVPPHHHRIPSWLPRLPAAAGPGCKRAWLLHSEPAVTVSSYGGADSACTHFWRAQACAPAAELRRRQVQVLYAVFDDGGTDEAAAGLLAQWRVEAPGGLENLDFADEVPSGPAAAIRLRTSLSSDRGKRAGVRCHRRGAPGVHPHAPAAAPHARGALARISPGVALRTRLPVQTGP
jgi:hypothetical protein